MISIQYMDTGGGTIQYHVKVKTQHVMNKVGKGTSQNISVTLGKGSVRRYRVLTLRPVKLTNLFRLQQPHV